MSTQDIAGSLSIPFGERNSFNTWLYARIIHYLKGIVFELGSATGDFSAILVEQNVPIVLSDPGKVNRDKLRQRFMRISNLKYVENIDFNRTDFQEAYSTIIGTIDTVLALNIGDNDFFSDTALLNAKELARPRGHIIIITPFKTAGFPGLYEDLEELKRHNYQQVDQLLRNCEVLKSSYFTVSQSIVRSAEFSHAFLIIARKLELSK